MNFNLSNLLLTLILFLCLSNVTTAQTFPQSYPEVTLDGEIKSLAWAGGINAVQFSEVDLNDDGEEDLFIFDRNGNVAMTFLNTGSDYIFAPAYLENFPPIKHWVLLKDYNGDGIKDIFMYSSIPGISGVEVHKGYYDGGKINFNKVEFPGRQFDLLYFPLPNGQPTQLYISTIDYPAIDDIDEDGDLDILTFNLGGGHVGYYKNLSVEQGFGTDTLIYFLQTDCWGGFYESGISTYLDLATTPGLCAERIAGEDPVDIRHAGSTLLTFDLDDDCDKELVLGDLSFDHLVLAINGGDCSRAWTNAQDTFFPSYNVPTNLPSFPASFFLDVDHDGLKDFIATRNAENGGEDYDAVWFYKNIQTNVMPRFELVKKDFLVERMIDFGTAAFPAAVDYDADGLLDIVVGNESFFIRGGSDKDSRLFLFKNTGTPSAPAFELVDDNWLDFKRFVPSNNNPSGTWSFTPAFGDLDGDGDMDLLVGAENGSLFYAENTAGPGNPMNFPNIIPNYLGIDIGRFSYPAIGDVNRDGLTDIVVGEENVRINYYQNIGTSGNPLFDPEENNAPNSVFLGRIDLREGDFNTGYGSPVLLDFDEKVMLLTGNEAGSLRLYSGVEIDPEGDFVLESANFGNTRNGFRVCPAMGDFDNDGVYEMVVGNQRGGLSFYETNLTLEGIISGTKEVVNKLPAKLAPNPVGDRLTIEIPYQEGVRKVAIKIFDVYGKEVAFINSASGKEVISTSHYSPGLYFVEVRERGASVVLRFVKH